MRLRIVARSAGWVIIAMCPASREYTVASSRAIASSWRDGGLRTIESVDDRHAVRRYRRGDEHDGEYARWHPLDHRRQSDAGQRVADQYDVLEIEIGDLVGNGMRA